VLENAVNVSAKSALNTALVLMKNWRSRALVSALSLYSTDTIFHIAQLQVAVVGVINMFKIMMFRIKTALRKPLL
jgi:hypothetical protein